ncbi:hypothetical protein SUGI_0845520 [Cryptomeria japonica]|uniref:uncharacterized protein LOC131034963 n=1 Tax=Cryptomeria japonica TaxID=3369 RepID=UPI002414C073|nr:uncharacterized protein LOC131034963 [Cryptomeria japonica]GLJ40873.1 hypothetical protein SUGI_0845520 [Cryptomeria japonica]
MLCSPLHFLYLSNTYILSVTADCFAGKDQVSSKSCEPDCKRTGSLVILLVSMARAMNALCEILPAKKMWSLGGEKQWNLPISAQDQSTSQRGLRKRISSFSMGYSARSEGNSTRSGSSWPFQRSQSMPSSGADSASLMKWVEWGWGWITRKKNILCRKISICGDEDLMLGDRRSSLNQAFCKIGAHFRKLVHRGPVRHEGFTYDSFNYAQNFDDGQLQGQDPINGKRYS